VQGDAVAQMLDALDGKPVPRIINPQVWPDYSKRFEKTFGFAPAPPPDGVYNRAGTPSVVSSRMLTGGPQLDVPLDSAITYPAALIDEYAWDSDLGDALDMRGNMNSRHVLKESVGVVGAIVPWNGPNYLSMLKIGPAMVAGCATVLKPAPEAPLDLYVLAEAAIAAGVPPGVLNIVAGGRGIARVGHRALLRSLRADHCDGRARGRVDVLSEQLIRR